MLICKCFKTDIKVTLQLAVKSILFLLNYSVFNHKTIQNFHHIIYDIFRHPKDTHFQLIFFLSIYPVALIDFL